MSGGQLNANADQYRRAVGLNAPPPPIVSDPLVAGATPIEQLLRVLGLAANAGDFQDNADSIAEHARREAKAIEAAEKFAAQDEGSAAELDGVSSQDHSAQLAQQLPQIVSGIAAALAGAVGGALQPLTQVPQQFAQGAQQALQTATGLFQQPTGGDFLPLDDTGLTTDPLMDEFGPAADDLVDLDGSSGESHEGLPGVGFGPAGGPGGTAPTALLGPPPIPSAGTSPSSAQFTGTPPSGGGTTTPPTSGGLAGMPMVPPGAMGGNAGADKDPKAETKRVSVPSVRNGAPVQGRLTAPPPLPPVAKTAEGKPVATRRITVRDSRSDDPDPGQDAKSGS